MIVIEGVRYPKHEEASCPFCEGRYTLAMNDDDGICLHTLPECAEFLKLDPLEFAEAARWAKTGVL